MIHFITGGSKGIGTELVLRAVRDGHDVAFTYFTNKTKAAEVIERAQELRADARCKAYALDVKDHDEVAQVAAKVLEDFGTVDVVINNAAANKDNLVVSMSDEEWHEVIDTNLSGPFYVAKAFLPAMVDKGFGRIINISSVSSGGSSGQCNYAAAKSGLHGLTLSLCKEYGRLGITTNAVVPGYFPTQMTEEGLADHMLSFWTNYVLVPEGRPGELHELASLVAFLASEESSMINGQMIHITGGLDWGP